MKFNVTDGPKGAAVTCQNEDTVCGLVLDQLNGDLIYFLVRKKKKNNFSRLESERIQGILSSRTSAVLFNHTQLGVWPVSHSV